MSFFSFKTVADEVTDEILADPFFSAIASASGAAIAVTEDPQDIDTGITAALNDIGLGIMVMLPHGRVTAPNEPGPVFDDATLVIVVAETPTLNRATASNPTAAEAAMELASLLHHWTDSSGTVWYVTHAAPVENKDYNTWNVGLAAGIALQPGGRPALAPVTAAPALPSGGASTAVVLSCATPGAAIFFTLDGTYPAPIQGSLYTAPVVVPAGTLLRARAWLSGYARPTPTETNLQY